MLLGIALLASNLASRKRLQWSIYNLFMKKASAADCKKTLAEPRGSRRRTDAAHPADQAGVAPSGFGSDSSPLAG